ncbi:MAG: methyltransferase domain-containing protein [archaeon]
MTDVSVDYHEQSAFWEKKRDKRLPTHPAVEAFAKPKVDAIARLIGITSQTMLLDVGCGTGFFTHYWKEKTPHVVGMDFSHEMLAKNNVPDLVRGSAEALPFDDQSFDVVFCSNLLHHVESPVDVVKEMARVTRRYVVLSEPNARNPLMNLFSRVVKEENGALKFDPGYLQSIGNNAGLREVYLGEEGSIVPNKTPGWAVPILKPFNKPMERGFYIVYVGDRLDTVEY